MAEIGQRAQATNNQVKVCDTLRGIVSGNTNNSLETPQSTELVSLTALFVLKADENRINFQKNAEST